MTSEECVKKIKKDVSIGFERRNQVQNVKSDAALYLNSKLHKYFEGYVVIIIGYDMIFETSNVIFLLKD